MFNPIPIHQELSMSSTAPVSPVPEQAVIRPSVPLGIIVAIACVAQFMVVLDTSIVNVALPSMRVDLRLSVNAQQWVVDGYLITFGGFLLLASRASDLFGRKWVFQAGLGLFTLASLVGGLATSGGMLLAARIVQGIGAAALAPSSLSLITASHTDPKERTRALTLWSIAASSAGAMGMILGGVLTAELSWRWVLFVNVPIGVALFAAATAYLLPYAGRADRPRLDVPGAMTGTLGVGALVFGISEATDKGWASGTVVVALLAAVFLLLGFVLVERRSDQPLIPLTIFRHRNVRTANIVMACLGVAMTSTIFFLSLYLQQVLGDSALRAGLSLVPMAVVLIGGTFASKALIPVIGPRALLVIGALVAAGGLVWLSKLPTTSSYAAHVLLPTLLTGSGVSLMLLPIAFAATTGVAPQDAGLASGLLNMGRQIGGALGLAILVTIAASVTNHSRLQPHDAAVVHGYGTAFLIAAVVSVLAAVAGTFLHVAPEAVPSPRAEARAEAQV
jgi:EmrB/QacA subfamily drug resistance transporter